MDESRAVSPQSTLNTQLHSISIQQLVAYATQSYDYEYIIQHQSLASRFFQPPFETRISNERSGFEQLSHNNETSTTKNKTTLLSWKFSRGENCGDSKRGTRRERERKRTEEAEKSAEEGERG